MKRLFYNLLAFLFGCILLISIFFILELISRPIYERNFKISIQEDPPVNIYTKEKQKTLNPGIRGTAVIKKGKLPPINYTYSIDKKGRRNTNQENDVEKKMNFLFMGCSFTFGTGVNDNETFPSQFAKLNPYCQVYNYGMPGGSPQEMYLMTLNPNFADDIENMPTVVVYTFISDHLKRLIGDWSILGKWGNNLPHIELIDNKLHILGNFNETKPFSCFFANTLYKSTLLSILFNQFGIDYPPKFTYKHYELL
ncbi:MAG TPA: hypothetical protein PLX23_12240 [Candidatus Hydrogenedens sp.]|nr:hypothetical protein [Candidatus Hydrogenedens sp.]